MIVNDFYEIDLCYFEQDHTFYTVTVHISPIQIFSIANK